MLKKTGTKMEANLVSSVTVNIGRNWKC